MAGFLARGLADPVTCPAVSHLPEEIGGAKADDSQISRGVHPVHCTATSVAFTSIRLAKRTNRMSVCENTNPLYSRGVGCDRSARFGSTLHIPILILQASPLGTIRTVSDRPSVLSLSIIIAADTDIHAT